MRVLISIGLGLSLTSGAFGASECPLVHQEVLALESWTITDTGADEYLRYEFEVSLRSNASQQITMVSGDVQFYDILDRHLASAMIEPDISVAPNEAVITTDRLREGRVWRLPDLDPDQVKTVVCLNSVAYADGTVEQFPIAR